VVAINVLHTTPQPSHALQSPGWIASTRLSVLGASLPLAGLLHSKELVFTESTRYTNTRISEPMVDSLILVSQLILDCNL